MIHPLLRKRFETARADGAGTRARARLQLITWAGWLWGFIRGR